MAQKTNIRSIRFSDELAELIDRQQGSSLTQKFENLISRSTNCAPSSPQYHGEAGARQPAGGVRVLGNRSSCGQNQEQASIADHGGTEEGPEAAVIVTIPVLCYVVIHDSPS